MPNRARDFFRGNTPHYVFVDLESIKYDKKSMILGPALYWMSRVHADPNSSTVITYSKPNPGVDNELKRLSHNRSNYYHYTIPSKSKHEVVDKAIVQDSMFISCLICRNYKDKCRKISIVSDDKDFYELVYNILETGVNAELISTRPCDNALWGVQGMITYVQIEDISEPAISNLPKADDPSIEDQNTNHVAVAISQHAQDQSPDTTISNSGTRSSSSDSTSQNISDVSTSAETVVVSNTNTIDEPMHYGYGLSVWRSKLRNYFDGITGMMVGLDGLEGFHKVFHYSQFGSAVGQVTKLPSGRSGKNSVLVSTASFLIQHGIIEIVIGAGPDSNKPTHARRIVNPSEHHNAVQRPFLFFLPDMSQIRPIYAHHRSRNNHSF